MAIIARSVKHASYKFLINYSTDNKKHIYIYINCLEKKGQWEGKRVMQGLTIEAGRGWEWGMMGKKSNLRKQTAPLITFIFYMVMMCGVECK